MILNNIKLFRKVTQRQMAADLGLSHVHVCNIENGKSMPSLDLAFRIAKYLNKPFHKIFWEETCEEE